MTSLKRLKLHCTIEEYLALLKAKRELISQGLPYDFFDDNTPGNKSLTCSWGLSQRDTQEAKVSIYSAFPCPLRRDDNKPSGCFYSCKVYKRKANEPKLTREYVLELYDKRIKEIENKIAQ